MKTKEEIIQALRGSKIVMINTGNPRNAEYIQHAINYIESMPKIHEEISTLNPMKIDEERMIGIWNNYPFSYNYGISGMSEMIKQYNSTCENHQVLQPLPKDKPEWFEWSLDTSKYDLWDELVKTYGTPTKKELVSVEELEKELIELQQQAYYGVRWETKLAQHIIDTYSLNPPKRDEFPFNLKKGDKFMGGGRECTLLKLETTPRLYTQKSGYFEATDCTPYHEPSIHDKFMASLSDEQKKMYEEIKESTK